MKVTTHHGEMHQSRGDYGTPIKHYRRPSHWPGTLVLLALMWIFVGLFLLAGCSEVADAQAFSEMRDDVAAVMLKKGGAA